MGVGGGGGVDNLLPLRLYSCCGCRPLGLGVDHGDEKVLWMMVRICDDISEFEFFFFWLFVFDVWLLLDQ